MGKVSFLLPVAALCLFTLSDARAEAVPEENYKIVKAWYDEVVNDDGTENTKNTMSIAILRQDGVDRFKQYPISYSTSAEKVEVVEAYTQKADGRRVDAPKNNFQVDVSGGREGAAPAFSDESTLTVVFPDVAVGDTINVVYNRAVIDPLFPKQFSNLHSFSRRVLYDDARVSYSIPLALKARYKSFGLKEDVNKQENGRQILSWSFKNAEVRKTKYTETPVMEIGDEPAVIVSTFPSYAAIAESYGARAKPKAAVTDEIKALAEEITKGKSEPREQVKALYDWEVANLTYAGNCIGIGSVVPRDLDFVLKNKMGDCKDHATLLQALLSAKGIVSTQALIGSNSIYTLPEIPEVDIVNHVINYIPSMDMYLDATSGMPFGYLPSSLGGKPVLLVDGYKEGARTPVREKGLRKMKAAARITINEDGSADGVTTFAITGPEGGSYEAQQRFKTMTPKRLEEAGEAALKGSGFQGSVTVEAGAWDEKTMTYTQNVRYHLKDYVRVGAPGAIYTTPPFAPESLGAAIGAVIAGMTVKDAEKLPHGFLCGEGMFEEDYQYVFPKNVKVLATPDNVSASTSVQAYDAKYTLSDQTVTITRKLTDTSPSPVCPPEIDDQYRELAPKVWGDLKAQIVYK
jgi:transglutaminase-like putative cysteine protease